MLASSNRFVIRIAESSNGRKSLETYHGGEFATGPCRSLTLTCIYGNDSNLVLVFLTMRIVLVAISIPATFVVFQVTICLGLFNHPKGQAFGIFGVCKRIVECPRAQFISKGSNQQMDGSFFGSRRVGVLLVVIIGTLVRRGADCWFDIDPTYIATRRTRNSISLNSSNIEIISALPSTLSHWDLTKWTVWKQTAIRFRVASYQTISMRMLFSLFLDSFSLLLCRIIFGLLVVCHLGYVLHCSR